MRHLTHCWIAGSASISKIRYGDCDKWAVRLVLATCSRIGSRHRPMLKRYEMGSKLKVFIRHADPRRSIIHSALFEGETTCGDLSCGRGIKVKFESRCGDRPAGVPAQWCRSRHRRSPSGFPSNSNSKSNVVIARQLLRRRRVVAEQERRECAVAVAPNISNAAHREARPESGQAQSHENAAQHEDREHEQRLCTTCAGVSSCPLNLNFQAATYTGN